MIGALDMFYLSHFQKIYHKEHIPFHYELAIGYDGETQTLYFVAYMMKSGFEVLE